MEPEIQKNKFTSEIYKKTENIRGKFGLHIDQLGELDAEILDVFNGYSKSKDFVDHIQNRLEIDHKTATDIAVDVNKEIFESLRQNMIQQGGRDNADNSSLEAAGGFTIEPTGQPNSHDDDMIEVVTEKDKEKLLAGIENPPPIKETISVREAMKPDPIRSEPLVDQLLKGSSSIPVEKITRKVEAETDNSPMPQAHTASTPPKNLPTNDSYREPIQ